MKKIRLLFFLSAFCYFPVMLFGQISKPGTPPSFDHPLLKQTVPVEVMRTVDTQRLLKEDMLLDSIKDIPWRFGDNIQVDMNPINSGVWDILPTGGRIWRVGVSSPGAYTINLTFDKYKLPPGAELYIYNADNSMILGAFTDYNNQEDGYFATSLVQGDQVFIEYYEPEGVAFPAELNLELVTHAYRDPMGYVKAFGQAGWCNLNVACPEAGPWEDQVNSTVMLVSGSNGFCSGSMVNNTANDATPYLLSANHCYANPGTLIVWFNWQSETCDNPPSSPPHDAMSGAVLRARHAASDFWLLEMNQPVPEDYNAYFAGWNRSQDATITTNITGVHHPRGDIKKFSYSTTGVQAASYLGSPGSGSTHWRIVWSGSTTTEGGSSGSAIFDDQGRILGQLHGGYASCSNLTAPDWYGRLGVSWDGGGSAASRLSDWLDPLGLDAQVWDGYDPFGEIVESPQEFSAQPLEFNAIALSWLQNENQNPVMIAVNTTNEFGNPSGPYSLGQEIAGGGTVLYIGEDQSFDHTELDYSTVYYYRAWSFSSNIRYSQGVEASAQTTDNGGVIFPAPSDLTAQLIPEDQAQLAWQAPVVDGDQPVLDGYLIYRNNTLISAIPDPEINIFSDAGLAVGTFEYHVTALYQNPAGESEPSNTALVVVEPAATQYTLEMNIEGSGTTDPSEGMHEFNQGTQVTALATASPHWNFLHWLADGLQVSDNPSYTFTMDQDYELTAVFVANQHTITLGSSPDELGVQTGGGTYSYGEFIDISTTVPPNWVFNFWRDNGTIISTSPGFTLQVTGDRNLTAHFIPVHYDITLEASPEEGGTVTGGGNYATGTQITVGASPSEGWDFNNWREGGQVVSSQPEYSFEVNGSRDLTAQFSIQSFQISGQVQPQGSGTISGLGSYNYGQTANLTAVVYSGWHFIGWEQNGEIISTDNPWSFQVYENKSLIALMGPAERTLTIAVDGEGTTVPAPGSYTFDMGQKIMLDAVPSEGWIFSKWVVNETEIVEPSFELEINDNINATAYFQDASSDRLSSFDSGITVYPIPATGTLFVGVKHISGMLRMSLNNINGQVIREIAHEISSEGAHPVSFDISGINAGIYILKVSDGKQAIYRKVIVR